MQPGRSSTRRWDIDSAILSFLESGPRTASRLFTFLNSRTWRARAPPESSPEIGARGARVDKRALMRHLGYLQRDGLIAVQPELRVLHHDRTMVVWNVKYYRLAGQWDIPPPPRTPLQGLQVVKEIHNPLKGEEGMIRFTRWLRDP